MAETSTLRESPLAQLTDRLAGTEDAAVSLRELPFLPMVAVRVDPDGPAAARLAAVLGSALPPACRQTAGTGGRTALWLGPDEWLVVGEADTGDGSATPARTLVDALTEALGDARGAVVDVSANRTTLELTGPRARQVLAKGCPVDLHPRAFGPGLAVTTTVGPVPVLLWQTAPEAYRLLPRASFADYLARWLLDATAEFVQGSPA